MSECSLDYTAAMFSSASTCAFCETNFKDPHDPELKTAWKPYGPQRLLYNVLDFGYDIENDEFEPIEPCEIVVLTMPRQRGKTEGCASAAGALALRYPNSTIGIISARDDTAKEFMDRIKWFISHSDFADMIIKERADRIVLNNGSRIVSLPNSEKAIKGWSFTWVFIDEAALIDDEVIEGAAMPTVVTAGRFQKFNTPSVILLSTPLQADGKFHEYYDRGISYRHIGCKSCKHIFPVSHPAFQKTKIHPYNPKFGNCPECGNNDWEYVAKEIYVYHHDPLVHPFKTPEQIMREFEKHGGDARARREYLGEFEVGGSGLLSEDDLIACADETISNEVIVEEDIDYGMSVDIGKSNDATVITIGHNDPNSINIIIDHVNILPGGEDVSYQQIRKFILTYIVKYNPYIIAIDAVGIGDAVVEQIYQDIFDLQHYGVEGKYKRNDSFIYYSFDVNPNIRTKIFNNKPSTKRKGFVTDYQAKKDMVEYVENVFNRHIIRIALRYSHKDITIMWKELLSYGYKFSKNNRILYGTQREHDDTFMSLAMLLQALKQFMWVDPELYSGGQDNFIL